MKIATWDVINMYWKLIFDALDHGEGKIQIEAAYLISIYTSCFLCISDQREATKKHPTIRWLHDKQQNACVERASEDIRDITRVCKAYTEFIRSKTRQLKVLKMDLDIGIYLRNVCTSRWYIRTVIYTDSELYEQWYIQTVIWGGGGWEADYHTMIFYNVM